MNFEDAIDGILAGGRRRNNSDRMLVRLDQGVYHVDYREDPDHAYLVTIQRVPRIRLPLPAPILAGEVNGVRALLVQVSVANHVEVTLGAEDTPATRATTEAYLAAERAWADTPGPDVHPPTSPGAEAFPHLPIAVTDDRGTAYRISGGSGGGPETPWRMHWDFRPAPPPDARRLTIRFPAGEVELPLPVRANPV